MENPKILVRTKELREELGVGATYMCALMAACNLSGHRIVQRATVMNFLKENPTWTMPRPNRKANRPQGE